MELDDILGLAVIPLVIEPLAFLAVWQALCADGHRRPSRLVATLYWAASIGVIALLVVAFIVAPRDADNAPQIPGGIILAFAAVYLAKALVAAIEGLDLLRRGTTWSVRRVLRRPPHKGRLTRVRLLPRMAVGLGCLLFVGVLWSGTFGRSSVRVYRQEVKLESLPAEFDGLRIVHLSDIHASSLGWSGPRLAGRMVAAVNAENPDIILYSGDFGEAAEFERMPEIFARLRAPFGKFAVLGNHDFGGRERASDNWTSPEDKRRKLEALAQAYRSRGVRLLVNDAAVISKAAAAIAILGTGVYDPHHGLADADLESAERLAGDASFNILIAHSPQYWEAAVQGRRPIYLTLAGHTHGAQIGVGVGPWMWSPAALVFRHWGGLYQEGNHYLYVNRGTGCVGLPFRLNMPADVSVVVLRSTRERP